MNPRETETDKQTQVLGTQMTIAGDQVLVNTSSSTRFKNQQATPMVGKGGIKPDDDTLTFKGSNPLTFVKPQSWMGGGF